MSFHYTYNLSAPLSSCLISTCRFLFRLFGPLVSLISHMMCLDCHAFVSWSAVVNAYKPWARTLICLYLLYPRRKGKCTLGFFFFNLSRPWRADSSWLFWSRCNQEINIAIQLNLGNHTVVVRLLPLYADVDRDSELGGGVVLKRRNEGL